MGRHLDALQNSTDGAISAAAWRAALDADKAEDAALEARRGCKIRWSSVQLTRKGMVDRMSRDLVMICSVKGSALESDLMARGWTQKQIAEYRNEAVPLANRIWNNRGRA